ncbi:hypothetical protein HAZT_HAZT006310 [Hyalella azteca]|uniref:Peptidase M14 domain-containing protein n=1 Tax=Hyalella azteca TaxID=294128 RepID=A0A6A0HHD5_HYAAZ|nr:hypothetical protein HAZT_HAZT006310 [Hyalella azteca]
MRVIGTTHENRSIYVMVVNPQGPTTNAMWIDGGMHAREWLSTAVALRDYRYGQTHEILYPASGTFTDWVVGSLGINLAYVIELPGEGGRGFLASPTDIMPTAKEVLFALKPL